MSAGISILMYHQIGEFAPMRKHRANYCSYRRFARQMALLHHFRFNVLTLDQALACLRDEQAVPVPPRPVVLTFDDGYENFLHYALPELRKYGFPAIVYVISGYIGRSAEWFAKDPGRPVPRLMNATQLREIRAAGIEVGSHTARHVKLGETDATTQRRETLASKWALEDLLGEEVRHFCYPFGSFNRGAARAAAEAGYASAATCLRGRAEVIDHPLALPRKGISFGDNLLGYVWKLAVKNRPKPALREWRTRLAAGL